MGNFSRDTFKLTNTMYQQITGEKVKDPKHYVGVRLQQGVPLVDADWNELEDIRKYEQRAFLKWVVGNGVPQGSDGFRIKDATVNDFTVNNGICYVDGWEVINIVNTQYTKQDLYNNTKLAAKWGVDPLPPLQMGPGKYTVYIDVWEREIDKQEDDRIVNDAIGIETCVRINREWVVRVAEGDQAPATKTDHAHYKLAILEVKQAPRASVTVTDLRRTGLAVLSKEITIKDGKVGIGTTTPDKLPLCILSSDDLWGSGISLDNRPAPGGKRYCITSNRGKLSISDMDNTADRLVIDGNGNVGIGTINPQAKLHVNGGDLKWGNNSCLRENQGGSIELGGDSSTPGTGTPYIDFHYKGLTQDYNTRIINDADGRLSVMAPVFSFSGRVGIGTEPKSPLHIIGNGGIFNLEGQDHAYIQWYPLGFAAKRKAWMGYGEANTTAFTIQNDEGRMHIYGSELLYLLNKSGVIISKEWGGNGNLTVEGGLGISGTLKTQRDLNAVPDTYDPKKLKSLHSDKAFLLFYKYSDQNWAGLGVDAGGHIWIRSGTTNNEAHVVLIGNGGFMATGDWKKT